MAPYEDDGLSDSPPGGGGAIWKAAFFGPGYVLGWNTDATSGDLPVYFEAAAWWAAAQ